MTVNDGNGLYDKYGMISKIKRSMDYVADLRGWARCVAIAEVTKELDALAEGLKKDDAENEKLREHYKAMMERAGYKVEETSFIEKGVNNDGKD